MHTLLITGSNRGIGFEFVRQYINHGWNVIATCRTPERANELNSLKDSFSNRLEVVGLNVGNLKSIEELSKKLSGTPIDLLISNAGVYGSSHNSFGDIDYDNWQETFLINTLAGAKLAECFVDNVACSQIKKMAFVTSKMGSISDNGSGGTYIYRSSRAALNAVVKSLSIDLRSRGISIALLHPGWVLTDMGGPNAWIDVQTSVSGLIKAIEETNLENSGTFRDYSRRVIPW